MTEKNENQKIDHDQNQENEINEDAEGNANKELEDFLRKRNLELENRARYASINAQNFIAKNENKTTEKEEPKNPDGVGEKKQGRDIKNPSVGAQEEWQRQQNLRSNPLSEDYLRAGGTKIPGMGYVAPMRPKEAEKKQEQQPSSKVPDSGMSIPGMRNHDSQAQAASMPNATNLTQEEHWRQRLAFQESLLKNFQNARRGSAEDIRIRKHNIESTEREIEDLKIKLGLISPEELEEKRKAAQLEEKERNKAELQRNERQLASILSAPDTGNAENKEWREKQIASLKKNIERLYALVPQGERLPINDEEEPIPDDEFTEQPKEEAKEEIKEAPEPDTKAVEAPQPEAQKKAPTQSLGFFDMDEEEEVEPVENEARTSVSGDQKSLLFDEGRNIRNALDAAFGDNPNQEPDDDGELQDMLSAKNRNANGNKKVYDVNALGVHVSVREGEVKETLTAMAGNIAQIVPEADEDIEPLPRDPVQGSQKKSDRDIEKMMEDAAQDELLDRLTARNPIGEALSVKKTEEPKLENFVPDGHPLENPDPNPKSKLDEALEEARIEAELKLLEQEIKQEAEEKAKKIEEQRRDSQMYDGIKELFTEQVDESEMYAGLGEMFTETVADSHKSVVFTSKLSSFASMYKLKVDEKQVGDCISKAWALMKSGDAKNMESGKKMLGDFFKSTLRSVFDIERNVSYNEHRIPEFNEIIISTNQLFRSAMYAFTDLYHDPQSESLYEPTAFGGLTAKELATLTAGDSLWRMDQKSDMAWDVQSRQAKELAEQWLKEDKPYEKMINEMNGIIESVKKGTLGKQEMYSKLTAAEWLLVNNEKMMIEDPEDPLNPMPNWGNRYWKAIIAARDACGIPKHTSMRELIQGDYAEIAKAVVSRHYNERQIEEHVLDPDVRELYDSYTNQMVEFATQSEASYISPPPKQNADEKTVETHEKETRWREPVESQNEREKMKNEPKIFSNRVIERSNELKIDASREDFR